MADTINTASVFTANFLNIFFNKTIVMLHVQNMIVWTVRLQYNIQLFSFID